MASHVPVSIQDENLHIHKGKNFRQVWMDSVYDFAKFLSHPGKTVAGCKVDVREVQKKGLKTRKALADLSKPGKTSFTGPKATVLKQKSAVPVKNSNSAPKNVHLTEEEIKQCNEWAKEGIEHIHFSGNDMHKFEQETREHNVDREVNEIMAGFHNWIQISHSQIFSGQTEVVERYDKDYLEFEATPERLWSPREHPEHDDSLFLRDDEDPSNSFVDDEQYCIPELKLKGQYQVEIA